MVSFQVGGDVLGMSELVGHKMVFLGEFHLPISTWGLGNGDGTQCNVTSCTVL